jgi:hypothetical protein
VTARILLVVTGDLEEVGLAAALGRIFSTATFGVTRAQAFTTGRVGVRQSAVPPPGSRTRRKCVRWCIGNARIRRIWSRPGTELRRLSGGLGPLGYRRLGLHLV